MNLALLLLAAITVDFYVEPAGPLPDASTVPELQRQLEERAGQPVEILSSDADCPGCDPSGLAKARGRPLVTVRRVEGVTLDRFVFKRFAPSGEQDGQAELDIPKGDSSDPARFRAALTTLFPRPISEPSPAAVEIEQTKPTPEGSEPSVVPWILLGVSAVCLGTSAVFGLKRADAIDTLNNAPPEGRELRDLRNQAATDGAIALTTLGAAALTLGASIIWSAAE